MAPVTSLDLKAALSQLLPSASPPCVCCNHSRSLHSLQNLSLDMEAADPGAQVYTLPGPPPGSIRTSEFDVSVKVGPECCDVNIDINIV